MSGLTRLLMFWRAALTMLILVGLLWLATDAQSQSPDGVLGLFALSLFISLGFILFGQRRFESGTVEASLEAQHQA